MVTKSIEKKLLMLTAGEDRCICIWDSNFSLISCFNIAATRFHAQDINPDMNLSCQSLDLFICQGVRNLSHEKSPGPPDPILLVGTRSGDILEAKLQIYFDGLTD